MLRRKKRLLGAVGLAVVAVMTAIAYALPAPEAAAVSVGTVGLKVQVKEKLDGLASVSILSLENYDTVVYKSGKITISYANVRRSGLRMSLKNGGVAKTREGAEDFAGTVTQLTIPDTCADALTDDYVTCEIPYTLDATLTAEEPRFVYMVTAQALTDGAVADEDDVLFYYQAAQVYFNDEWDSATGNPVIEIRAQDQVDKFVIQVFDANDKKMFVGANGSDEPIILTRDELTFEDGVAKYTLPFDKYNATTGVYEVGLVAYDTKSDTPEVPVSMSRAKSKINYNKGGGENPGGPGMPTDPDNPDDPNNPDTPEVPDTGLNMFRNLNISSADYIITGLVAFGVVTAFAMFLIVRRNRR